MCELTDDELDQLFLNVELGEPEKNVINLVPHIRLLATVGSPADEPKNGARLALAEGGNGVLQPEGGSGQRPSLSPNPIWCFELELEL